MLEMNYYAHITIKVSNMNPITVWLVSLAVTMFTGGVDNL